MAMTFENFFWCPGNLGEGTDEFAKFNIRFNNLVELLQESPTQPPICEWKNSDAREHMAKLQEVRDPEGGDGKKGFKENEMNLILEFLGKAQTSPPPGAPPRARGPRLTSRPPPAPNFKYGDILIKPFGIANFESMGVLGRWDELLRYEQDRNRMWQRPGEGPLVPLQDIVQVIDEYGKQNEWDKDPDGRYTMRPIQGATLPNSLRGYNLVATAETG